AELLARRMAVGVRPTIHVHWVRDIHHTPTIRSIRAPDPFGLCCASDHKDTTGSDGPWAYQCFKGRESMLAALERRGIPIAQKSRQHRNHIEARIFVFLTKHHVRPQASQGLNSAEKRSSRIRYKCTQGSPGPATNRSEPACACFRRECVDILHTDAGHAIEPRARQENHFRSGRCMDARMGLAMRREGCPASRRASAPP